MVERGVRDPLTGRAAAIRDAARELLEEAGPEGLSMRPLAERVGVHPPAVYRHFDDKRAVESSIVTQAFYELGDVLVAAERSDGDALSAVCRAYRSWAVEHPHVFRLVFERPPDQQVDPDAERHAGAPMRSITRGDDTAARAVWACAHGLVILELDGRLPPGPDLDAAWEFVLRALRSELE